MMYVPAMVGRLIAVAVGGAMMTDNTMVGMGMTEFVMLIRVAEHLMRVTAKL